MDGLIYSHLQFPLFKLYGMSRIVFGGNFYKEYNLVHFNDRREQNAQNKRMEHNLNYKKKKKREGIPEAPYKILGRSFYQWLLVGGWTVHEGDLHEYSNLFGLFLLVKEVIF